jgi:hypothetical protein
MGFWSKIRDGFEKVSNVADTVGGHADKWNRMRQNVGDLWNRRDPYRTVPKSYLGGLAGGDRRFR